MHRAVLILLVLASFIPLLYVMIGDVSLRSAASVQEIPIYAVCVTTAARMLSGKLAWKVMARAIAMIGIIFALIAILVGLMPFQENLQAAKTLELGYPIGLNFFLTNTVFPQVALIALLLTSYLRWPENISVTNERKVFS